MSNLSLAGRVFDLLPLPWETVALVHARTHHRSEYGCSPVGARARSPLADSSVKSCRETNNHDQEPLSYARNP